MKLLSTNYKLAKEVPGWTIRGLSLAPADIASPGKSVCTWSTVECRRVCINTSGMAQVKGGVYQGETSQERHETFMKYQIHRARIFKTLMFLSAREQFMVQLDHEIRREAESADKKGKKLAVRLNVFSDIVWEKIDVAPCESIMERYPHVQFFDYTKSRVRVRSYAYGGMPSNYYLVFSRSEEESEDDIRDIISIGVNVAVVFQDVPTSWLGFRVINGDESDHRFLDPKGVIVGLKEKTRAHKDISGFVIR